MLVRKQVAAPAPHAAECGMRVAGSPHAVESAHHSDAGLQPRAQDGLTNGATDPRTHTETPVCGHIQCRGLSYQILGTEPQEFERFIGRRVIG